MILLDLEAPHLPVILCGACKQPLWRRQSRQLGYGLDCAEKLGIIPPARPHFTKKAGGDCEGQIDLFRDDS